MTLKLDLSKAYDRVEQDFLKMMMAKIGFLPYFNDMIMQCIQPTSYRILVNGQPLDSFSPTRGIRRGDPLSPFLFLICAQGFSGLTRYKIACGTRKGIRMGREAPKLTHLLFTDDILLFMEASQMAAHTLLNVLSRYQQLYGQMISFKKSIIAFA